MRTRPDAQPEDPVVLARQSFEGRRWGEAFRRLMAANEAGGLHAEDLERLAVAAQLVGADTVSDATWQRAHELRLAAGDDVGAARCAWWLGWNLLLRGETARSGGWMSRARSLVDDGERDCAVRGLLLIPEALGQLGADPAEAFAAFSAAGEIGARFADGDLVAISRLGRGEALIAMGDIGRGTVFLDETMVAVTTGEVSAPMAGVIYCAVLLECRKAFDTRRAREWTDVFARWCDAQPDLVPYRGQCLVHRSEVLQLEGRWPDALAEARRACERLAGHPAIGDAYYQQAEMHRLRGDNGDAEVAYRRASRYGRDPQPGLTLLRLAQGRLSSARAAIGRVLEEARHPSRRSVVLAAYAEVMLAAGDLDQARTAAGELAELAAGLHAPMLGALAQHTQGAVLVAAGHAARALEVLRGAFSAWQDLGAPYESARARALIATAYRLLGDDDSAALEFDAARVVFESLGARPDLARLPSGPIQASPAGLTARQAEVLKLVAAGKSNQEIALELVVSTHTVRRHLQNIFVRIDVTSRAGATAFAFREGLV